MSLIHQSSSITLITLKKRSDFLRISSVRNGFGQAGFMLTAAPRPESADKQGASLRVGFTATKKLGSAVVRNRAKRRLREAVRVVFPHHAKPQLDYVLIAREGSLNEPFTELTKSLSFALSRLHKKIAAHDTPSHTSRA